MVHNQVIENHIYIYSFKTTLYLQQSLDNDLVTIPQYATSLWIQPYVLFGRMTGG